MSRSRRRLDTSPIEYDEVVDSPALKGMVSFLEVPPGALPKLDFSQPQNPDKGTPDSIISELGIPKTAVPGITTADIAAPVSAVSSDTGAEDALAQDEIRRQPGWTAT